MIYDLPLPLMKQAQQTEIIADPLLLTRAEGDQGYPLGHILDADKHKSQVII